MPISEPYYLFKIFLILQRSLEIFLSFRWVSTGLLRAETSQRSRRYFYETTWQRPNWSLKTKTVKRKCWKAWRWKAKEQNNKTYIITILVAGSKNDGSYSCHLHRLLASLLHNVNHSCIIIIIFSFSSTSFPKSSSSTALDADGKKTQTD